MGRFETELEDLKKRQKKLEHSYSNIGTIRFLMFLVMLGGLIQPSTLPATFETSVLMRLSRSPE